MYATVPDSTNVLLINFIPRVFLDEDTDNQLRQFLTAINETLNEIHTYIRTLPEQFNIDDCDDVFIKDLAQIVGFGFDYFAPTDIQKKKKIKVLLRLLRKKGTNYCVQLALQELDSTGDVVHMATKLMVPSQQGLLSTLNCYIQNDYHYHEGSIEVVTDTYVDPDELWDLLEDIWPLGFVCWVRQHGTWPGSHTSFTDRYLNMNSIAVVTMNDEKSILRDDLTVTMNEATGTTVDLRSNLDPIFDSDTTGFIPTEVSDCVMWLRPDFGITKDGTNVSEWADLSDSGIIFEPSPHNAPSCEEITVGSATFDTVKFTAANEEALRSTNPTVDLPISGQDITQFNIFYCDDWDVYNSVHPILNWSGDHYSKLFYLFRPFHTNAGARFEIKSGIYGMNITGEDVVDPESKVQCFYGNRNNTTSKVRMYTSGNGFMKEASVGDSHSAIDWLQIGHDTASADHWSNLNLAEVIVYNRILNNDEMTAVKEYITERYGVVFV